MRMSIAPGLVLCFSMIMVADASAQLTAAKDGPIVYGHHHVEHHERRRSEEIFRRYPGRSGDQGRDEQRSRS